MGKDCKWRLLAAAGCALGLAGLAGCASTASQSPRPREVTLADFSGPASDVSTIAPTSAPDTGVDDGAMQGSAESATSPATSSATMAAATTAPVPGPAAPGRVLQPGDQIVIDRVVGQVSGRPIFADALLEPIGDRLAAEAKRVSGQQFINVALQIINEELTQQVLNELFKAEAEAALTEQQKMGLLAFIRDFQERTIASKGGSRTSLEAELAREGITAEDLTQAERDRVLIGNLLNEKIEPRVIVSWKDVEREYERRRDQFVPAAKVTLKRIRLSTADQKTLIEQVRSRLEAGETFDALFDELGAPEAGVMEPVTMGAGGLGEIPLNPAYQQALRGLEVGQTTAPILLDDLTVWLHVESIDQPEGKSLYDVQRQLAQEIYIRRRDEQRQIYIRTLLEKGIYDELDEMTRRVLTVALLRYAS